MSSISRASDVGRVADLDRPERLTDSELDDCRGARRAEHVAARVLAKRLVADLLDLSVQDAEGWRRIECRRRASGQPYLVLHPPLDVDGRLHVSWSHTAELVTVVVVHIPA